MRGGYELPSSARLSPALRVDLVDQESLAALETPRRPTNHGAGHLSRAAGGQDGGSGPSGEAQLAVRQR